MPVRDFGLVFLGITLAMGLQAKVEFEAVRIGHSHEETFDLRRACTTGFKSLRKYFLETGVRFDPKIVQSNRGRYCHLYYEPTVRGFEAERVGASWIEGSVNGRGILLVPKQDVQLILEDELPEGVPFMLSKLRWHSREIELFKGAQQEQSRVMIYGEMARRLVGKAVSDKEYEYLLKVEFGVDAVKRRSKNLVKGSEL